MFSLRKSLWLVLVFPVLFVECPYLTGAEPRYRMEGVVTDGETNQPVAGATVRVVVEAHSDRILQSQTDREGRYVIELPAGHAHYNWPPIIPPEGYFLVGEKPTGSFATTPDAPVHTRNYQVKRGVPIRFAVKYPKEKPDRVYGEMHIINIYNVGDNDLRSISETFYLDEQGRVTIAWEENPVGKFSIRWTVRDSQVRVPERAIVDFEEGFDLDQVQPEVIQEDKSLLLRDANGKTVRLLGCLPELDGKSLTFVVPPEMLDPEKDFIQLKGRIVDADGNGISGASVLYRMHSRNSRLFFPNDKQITDSHGDFTHLVPRRNNFDRVVIGISSPGYINRDFESRRRIKDDVSEINIGEVTLEKGISLVAVVTDLHGSPLHGAVVEAADRSSFFINSARTGSEGECLLTDHSPRESISANFGHLTSIPHFRQYRSAHVRRDGTRLIKLKLSAWVPEGWLLTPSLSPGSPAPEWKIRDWSDDKERQLADYLGKVVLLYFWQKGSDFDSGFDMDEIRLLESIQRRFQDQDVVLLGIHAAGTNMPRLKSSLEEADCNLPVGLDVEEANGSGETVRRYAIEGFPTLILIDRNGNIAPQDRQEFNQKIQEIAKSSRTNSFAGRENSVSRVSSVMKLQLLSREIEAALKIEQE